MITRSSEVALQAAAIAAAIGLAALAAGCAAAPAAVSNASAKPSPVVERVAHRELMVPAGTVLRVRLDQSLDTARHAPGTGFTGAVTAPVTVNGRTLIARGARVHGIVANSSASGRLRGRAVMTVALKSIEVNGSRVPIYTTSVTRVSAAHKKRNLALIGGGSGLGALIGGLAGGGKGALIGAGAGAAAGTAGAAATGKRQVRIPAESVLSFRLRQPVTV